MPANHCMPHTSEARARMSAAHAGRPRPWRRRPTKMVDGVMQYRCGRCRMFFAREGFHTSKRDAFGIKTNCKPCHSKISIASRDPVITRLNGQRAEAARRARKAGTGGVVTAADWREVLSILGSACLSCASTAAPTQDHIMPLSKGGAHHPANLQPLCRPCNERKQARHIDYRTPEQRADVAARWVVEFKRMKP
jgi:5-methylcytosine-specific restriction endonuclease McrA